MTFVGLSGLIFGGSPERLRYLRAFFLQVAVRGPDVCDPPGILRRGLCWRDHLFEHGDFAAGSCAALVLSPNSEVPFYQSARCTRLRSQIGVSLTRR